MCIDKVLDLIILLAKHYIYFQMEKQCTLSICFLKIVKYRYHLEKYHSMINNNLDLCELLGKPYTELLMWAQVVEAAISHLVSSSFYFLSPHF